jgi:putative flippase GtrA
LKALRLKVVRYAVVGGIATVVDFGIFTLFAVTMAYPYLLVGASSFAAGTLVNYLLSIRFVFASGVRFKRRTELAMVFLVSSVGLALHQLFLYLFVEFLALHLLAAKVLATGLVFSWNFGIRRYYVFAAKP